MGIELELEESDFKGYIPDQTILDAKVVSIVKKKQNFVDEDGNPVFKLEWKFEITEDGNWLGQNVYGKTGIKFNNHPNNTLFTWSQAVIGVELPVGYGLDTDDLLDVGCRVRMMLEEYDDKKTGAKKQTNKVADVLPSLENQGNFAVDQDEEPF